MTTYNDMSKEELLNFAIDSGIINIKDTLNKIKDMKRDEILAKHPYKIWHATNDNRWKTYVKDPTHKKGKRLVPKSSREALEDVIISEYRATQERKKKRPTTIKELYLEWLSFKELHTDSSSYISIINGDWNRFYEPDTDFINQDIKTVDSIQLDEWVHKKIKEHSMTKTTYYNMSIILRQSFIYAEEKKYIAKNPFEKVKISKKLFVKTKKKESHTQVFLIDEKPEVISHLQAIADDDTTKTAPYAIMLDFETGIRVGELVAVKETDLSECGNYVHIQRQEVREYERTGTVSKLIGVKVVEYTKSDDSDRMVFLTSYAKSLIQKVLQLNAINKQYCDDYLFVQDNKRITHYVIDATLEATCKSVGIINKTIHKARKTYISTLIDAHVNINEIRQQVGHSDERITYKNYCFNRRSATETERQIEQALSQPIPTANIAKSVIPCNTKIVQFSAIKNDVNPSKIKEFTS